MNFNKKQKFLCTYSKTTNMEEHLQIVNDMIVSADKV